MIAAKILIVDDDDFICEITRAVLEDAGYTVDVAEDGLVAWERLSLNPKEFDLILLDKNMPRMDGISLLKKIKADERLKALPIIMLTGSSGQEDILEGLALGASYYLTKPSSEDVLKRVVHNVLSEVRRLNELQSQVGQNSNYLRLLTRAEFCCRTLSEVKDLALVLAEASGSPDRTVKGYSELLINAIEHGNLEISYEEKGHLLSEGRWETEVKSRLLHPYYLDRVVMVSYEKTDEGSVVTIADEGGGFNWEEYMDFSHERVFDLNGRGIAMSRSLSFDRMEYQNNGSTVIATVFKV